MKFFLSSGVDAFNWIKKKEGNVLEIIPFNSKRKRASCAIQHPDHPNKVRVFCKGAPEIVLDFCDKYFDKNGSVVTLGKQQKENLIKNVV